ncbi:MAG TPA: glycoside hydrolase domain-containing protein [Planctomycetota bacterium]|jgi:hypothetical protein
MPRALAVLSLLVFSALLSAAEFRVPLMPQAPKVDGNIDPAEWACSAGFDGLAFNGTLQQRRAQAFIGATETTIFVAIRSQLPDEGTLAADPQKDSLKAVFDDAVEVFVNPTPDAEDKVDYQFLVNSLGKGGYDVHAAGKAAPDVAWKGNWTQAHGMHDGYWHFECALPLDSIAKGRKATDGAFTINVCRDWKNPWEWSSLSGGYALAGCRFTFVNAPAPAVQYSCAADPLVAAFDGVLTLRNPSKEPIELNALMRLDRNRMPELIAQDTVKLAPGAQQQLTIKVPGDDPTTRYQLRIAVKSADGKTTFYDRETIWQRAKALRWLANKKPEVLPLDFRFAYYPYLNKLRIAADVSGLPKEARLQGLSADVRKKEDRTVVKSVLFPVDKFKEGRQELAIELPPLQGEYEIALKAKGENVPSAEVVKTFERKAYPWEHTPAGRSTKVYPPFTPIKLDGKKLSTVLREHTLNEVGLWDQVTATSAHTGISKAILSAPMRYVAKVDGQDAPLQAEPLKITSAKEHQVIASGAFKAGALSATFITTWDYDGTERVDLTLLPTGGKTIDALTLEIPLSDETAPMIHANSDRIRAPIAQRLPAAEEVGPASAPAGRDAGTTVFDARKLACDDYVKNFCPYIFLGNAVRGLCWFAENGRGWNWDPATPNLEVIRSGKNVTLRIHLINKAIALTEARTITFGLLAAPVKPRLSPENPNYWRYRFYRDHYALLGTDINWLSMNTCGSVYPAGQDMYLWEMIARGNRGKLSDAEINGVCEWGKKYFLPYGDEAVKTFVAHVRHNLSCHLGQKMVFYYNRATYQGCDEFETFKDEWLLDDLRTVGKGNGLGEIKIVPSESYIDHALYWYARSFEIGNNKGVYWDNWFIAPSFNTAMTDAFSGPDGSIVPAAGIWQHRELCKRTFVMMNERGMLPITFPHMTSFASLPMLSFATVQYEWEWKYSLGDVQDRYTPEYIQLVTIGDQAGVWPVPLGDQGKLTDDPFTQKTFTGVRMVHELDGYGGVNVKENAKLLEPILALLDDPKLRVWRYWDERPMPVSVGLLYSKRDEVSRSIEPLVPLIVYCVPGKEAVVALTSYSRQKELIKLTIDFKAMELPADTPVVDVESGEKLKVENGALDLMLNKHDLRVLRIKK